MNAVAITHRAECGFNRFHARYRIREVLDSRNLTMADVARRLGVSSETVSATVRGRIHSKKVLDELRSLGVPERYLFDPNRQ